MSTNRTMTAAMEAALQTNDVRLVLIGRLDIVSDPVKSWTGPGTFLPTGSGDTALDGETFTPMAPFISLTSILEDMGIGGPLTLTVAGQDLDEDLLRQVVRDKRAWRGKPAYLWLGLLNTADGYSVIADPIRIKTGIMVQMTTNRGPEGAIVNVTIDEDLGNAKSAPFRWVDHSRIFSSDTWSTYILKLANKPEGFGVVTGNPTGQRGGQVTIDDRVRHK